MSVVGTLNRSASVGAGSHATSANGSGSNSVISGSNSHSSSSTETLSFAPRNAARQPLYRPAALRRTDTSTSDLILLCTPSPPVSPKPASRDLRGLAAALGLTLANDSTKTETVSPEDVKGIAVDKAKWQADSDAATCSDDDCSVKFGVIDRRHHCRRCGMVFCASHSSRSALLWASAEQSYASPRPTPKTTPRSSALDIPSLQHAQQSYFTVQPRSSSQSRSSSGASTPVAHSPPAYAYPAVISARVCDSCYFTAAPSPPLLTPPLSGNIRFGHRSPSRSRSPVPEQRIPRSRQGSGSTASSGSQFSTNSPFLTFAAKEHREERRRKGQRAQSPATSIKSSGAPGSRTMFTASPPSSLPSEVTGPESDDDDDDRNALHEHDEPTFVPYQPKEDKTNPPATVGSIGWGGWATF